MGRIPTALAAVLAAITPASAVAGDVACKLCEEARDVQERTPIAIDIESGLNFSRMALLSRGDGEAEIDPLNGRKRTDNNLVDLDGVAFSGRARVVGEPFQPIRVDLPRSVMLVSPGGAEAELTDFVTDLPEMPVLGADGTLEFTFGGKLRTRSGGSGNFRGRIPIRVDYN